MAIARWFVASDEPPPFDRIDDPGTPVIIAGFGRVGQIVGRVLNMRNIKFTAVDASPDHVGFGAPLRQQDLLRRRHPAI